MTHRMAACKLAQWRGRDTETQIRMIMRTMTIEQIVAVLDDMGCHVDWHVEGDGGAAC